MDQPTWINPVSGVSEPTLTRFGGVDVWTAKTSFAAWPGVEPSDHEMNCRKGRGLVRGIDGAMSCAEVEIAAQFRQAGWKAGWLATCGRRNHRWREFMYATAAPAQSVLPDPVPLLPGRVASMVIRNGSAGYPDVVAWQSERHPVFLELKGPGDRGTAQAAWVENALRNESIRLSDFLLLQWTFRPD